MKPEDWIAFEEREPDKGQDILVAKGVCRAAWNEATRRAKEGK